MDLYQISREKLNSKRLIISTLWLTAFLSGVVGLIDIYNFIDALFNGGVATIFLLFISVVFYSITTISAIRLLKNQYSRFSFRMVRFFWIIQIAFFDFLGNQYVYVVGPKISFYLKWLVGVEFNFNINAFTREFFLRIGQFSSDSILLGINLIPLLLTIALTRSSRKIEFLWDLRKVEEDQTT